VSFVRIVQWVEDSCKANYCRGIVHRDNGNQAKAEADFAKAKELGCEPE